MKNEKRNERICEMYLTTNFSIKNISDKYNLTTERVRQIIKSLIGEETFLLIKKQRKEKVAEQLKKDYLKGIWGKK